MHVYVFVYAVLGAVAWSKGMDHNLVLAFGICVNVWAAALMLDERRRRG